MSTNTCPICNKDDAIQKVSALVTGGRSSGTFSGPSGGSTYVGGEWVYVSGHATLSGSSETDLARLLASPPSPKQPNTGVTFSDSVVFMFLLSITTCAGYAIGILLFIGLERNQPSLVTGEHNQLFILIGGLLLAGISSLVIFLPPIIISHRMINSRVAREKAKYDIEKPAWNRAMEKYQGLYFCHRDGIVFDPETRETCQPTSLREFLYKSTVSAPLPTKPPPSKPLSATPPKGIQQIPDNAGSDVGRLEPTQKPWYRSIVFLVLMFSFSSQSGLF